jgi:hypothetical protein
VVIDEKAFTRAVQKYEHARAEVSKFAAPRTHPMEETGCSFCCRPKRQIRGAVAGPNVFICDQCVVMCYQILKEQGHIEEAI